MTRTRKHFQSPVNDDDYERSQRRKKMAIDRKLTNQQLKSPSLLKSPLTSPKGVLKPTLMSPSANRLLFNSASTSATSSPLLSTKMGTAPTLNKEQASKQFEEWIKIAADNKINANNTWNLALIDYFSEMSLLKDGDNINFQKASCTLDGCVKIYTSRVDSVASETGKLLTGLSENEKKKKNKEEEEDDDVDIEEETSGRKKKSKTNTLEKSFAALNVKKFDLEFSVDPLFKKTCADFDEGGAKGLLMNNLMLSSSGKVVFDASDEIDDHEEASGEMDFSKLRKFLPEDIMTREVCPSFKSFELEDQGFSSTINQLLQKLTTLNLDENNEDDELADLLDFQPTQQANFHVDDDPVFFDDEGDEEIVHETKTAQVIGFEEGSGEMFSMFDSSLNKHWTGADHWKLKPFFQKKKDSKPQVKKEKKIFSIDFLNSAPVDISALFSNRTASGTISNLQLSKQALIDRTVQTNVLPHDYHFSSKNLLSLFTKPSWTMTKKKVLFNEPLETTFWTQENLQSSHAEGMYAETGPLLEDDTPFPESNQMEDLDDSSSEVGFQMDDDHGDELLSNPYLKSLDVAFDFGNSLVAEPKLTKTLKMNYARTAKKVDVKKLKENIWKEIEQEDHKEMQFSSLVTGLNSIYPAEKMSEISFPFCFICLLHLANEQNLTIKGSDGLSELIVIRDQ